MLAVLGLTAPGRAMAQSAGPGTSAAAADSSRAASAYVGGVLRFIQENGVRGADRADWPRLRRDALAAAAQARSTRDAYGVIRRVLGRLGDRHSRFFTPEEARGIARGRVGGFGLKALYPQGTVAQVDPGGPADRAGIRAGDRLERVAGAFVRPDGRGVLVDLAGDSLRAVVRKAGSRRTAMIVLAREPVSVNREPAARRLPRGIGYLELPEHLGSGALGSGGTYQSIAQRAIARADHPRACGWIVDLRRNGGGNLWPMLAGVGPILGEGDAGTFVGRGARSTWSYRAGRALVSGTTAAEVENAYVLASPAPPVAVLTSRVTASSGEAVAIAFRGRAGVRSFGEATEGVPTANVRKELPDGALLVLTTALDADRAGRTYEERIPPDEPVRTDWTRFGSEADPVVRAAERWLGRQPACRAPVRASGPARTAGHRAPGRAVTSRPLRSRPRCAGCRPGCRNACRRGSR